MLREIVRPTRRQLNIEIPREYVNKEIEILVLPLFEMEMPPGKVQQREDKNLVKLFKNAPFVKIDKSVDIDELMNEVNDVVL